MERVRLPPFPTGTVAPANGAALARAGIGLRPATVRDLPFLTQLYAAWRMPELLLLPWPAEEKQAFGESQFELQHRHLVERFVDADFWVVINHAGYAIGRLYLDRAGSEWRLVDILLAAQVRGQGLGNALLGWTQELAAAAGASLTLHVAANNPRAHALYRRNGFADLEGGDAMHQRMQWLPIRR